MIRVIRRYLYLTALVFAAGAAASTVSARVALLPVVVGDVPHKAEDEFIKANQNTTPYKAARAALVSASAIVLGSAVQDEVLLARWMIQLQQAPYSMTALYTDGLKFSDAVTFLKKWQLLESSSANTDRGLMIDRTYMEVFGRESTAAEYGYWDAKIKKDKVWYAPIVFEHIAFLNSHKDERAAAIQRVYKASMGRAATAQDLAYWTPRKEHYRLMREAARTFLYSPQGAKDLVAMVTLVFQELPKFNGANSGPTDADLKSIMTLVSGMTPKPIYEDLVGKKIW